MGEKPENVGNEVAAPVQGSVVQAGAIHGDVHFHGTTDSMIPRQLPGATRHFVNRAVEQDMLTTLLASAQTEGVVLLSTIDGTAGVGKSTLAVHWAHQVRDRFPDGELYVNLRGFDPIAEPMTPNEALGLFLTALDVEPERIPPSDDARAAMFRSLVHDKRMLVLLDNARTADQVRALLPGTPSCLVLVTSRNRLDDLAVREGATRLALTVLTEPESRELLVHYLGEVRLSEEPEAVAEIVSHCAGLPLALGMVAVRAAEFADFPLDELVEELRNERERLDALDAGGETGVRAVFSWSYRSLSAEAARLFRLLGLPTGPDISLEAVAALADRTRRDLRRPLAELLRANLIEQPEQGRYRFHDLLRAYAAECAAVDESTDNRHAAVRRLLDFYLRSSTAADHQTASHARYFMPKPPTSDVRGLSFDTDDVAFAWWEVERHNLRAATKQAASMGMREHAWQLPRTLMVLFHLRGYAQDWIEAYEIGIGAAREVGDEVAQANLQHELGIAYFDLSKIDLSVRETRRAIALFERIGDRNGELLSLVTLGQVLALVGFAEQARGPMDRAFELELQYRNGYIRGGIYFTLGLIELHQGAPENAIDHFGNSLDAWRLVGEEMGEGNALAKIAEAHVRLGRFDESARFFKKARDRQHEIGHRRGEAASLRGLGASLQELGDLGGARDAWQEAVALLEALHLPDVDEVRADLDGLENRLLD
ncbi:tetratricopeptide repeat protein [Saccharopolyspora sp. K220]|uniref:ATP-binding protein n=1 Tax=Saccharopolyspora soli TaxID=2926618 RepID=UPI001F58F263|nr:tetratricopeptide repeat protein [Saccharopolyspora soli]MCI2418983.1 tetratricopeptide repeat protein [Saccharopolyspora soli]